MLRCPGLYRRNITINHRLLQGLGKSGRRNGSNTSFTAFPDGKKSLYDNTQERDSCGVGLVAHLKKIPSRSIVEDANEMLVRMSHRGGCGCEVNAGDGAGMLVGMPHSYYKRVVKESLGKTLGPMNSFGTGIVFMPPSESAVEVIKKAFQTQVEDLGFKVIGWRRVETGRRKPLFLSSLLLIISTSL